MADDIEPDADDPGRHDAFDEEGTDRVQFEHLVEEAEQLCSNLIEMQRRQPEEKSDCVKQLIATMYNLHHTISPFESLYADFLKKRGISKGKSKNPYHLTVRAVMEQFDTKKVRSLSTHYAQACFVMKLENVESGDVVQWLSEPLKTDKGGSGLTGLTKVKHLWSLTPDGMAQRELKKADKIDKANKIVANTAESGDGQIEGQIAADRTNILEGSAGLALVRITDGNPEIISFLTTDVAKTAAAIKACQPT